MARYLVRVRVELEIEATTENQARRAAEGLAASGDFQWAEGYRLVGIGSVTRKDKAGE